MTDKDVFYVEIHNPVDFRRSVLEASRDLLRGLQKYEDLKKVRNKKLKEISILKSVIKEINSLVNQARNVLPSVNAPVPDIPKVKVVNIKKTATPAKKGAKKGVKAEPKIGEVAELETQLKDIEGKLASLG
ncbi:hypothetical protein ACFL96_07115 [Thermoproteota archaeon]